MGNFGPVVGKDRPSTIYTLSDPESGEVRYVGVTCRPLHHRRWNHEKLAQSGGGARCGAWIRTLQARGLRPAANALEVSVSRTREIFWIAHYREAGARLTNIGLGGDGCCGYKPTDEQRAAISRRLTGRVLSDETRAAIAEGLRGTRASAETKKKLSAIHRGRKKSAETRERMGAHQRGKSKSPAHIETLRAAQRARGLRQREAFMPLIIRREALARYMQGERSRAELARQYGVSSSFFYKMIKQEQADAAR